MKPFSLPALAVAAARARETLRAGKLFDDPLASSLAGPEGVAWLECVDAALPPPTGLGPSPLAVRTRFFDDFLLGALTAPSLRQVVLVAAGMDARAFRLAWPDGVTLFELDDPALLARKAEVLAAAGVAPLCTRNAVAVDLTGDWTGPLLDAGFDRARPSVWLIEGLLPYLDEAGVHALLQPLSSLAAPGSVLGGDLPGKGALASPLLAPLMALLAERGVPWRFGAESPETLFSLYGWIPSVVETWEAAGRYGFPARPAPPRSISGVPRSFLVTARRR